MTLPTAVLADDHALVIEGMRRVLATHVQILATCSNGVELLETTRRLRPELVIADVSMPGMSGIDFLRAVQHDPPSKRPRVILLSMFADEDIVASALRRGALGYVTKLALGDELVDAVQAVRRGMRYLSSGIREAPHGIESVADPTPRIALSARQREVLQRVAAGKRMKEIAAELRLSRRTVEMHKYQVMRVLGVRTTAELIRYFVRHESELGPLDGTVA